MELAVVVGAAADVVVGATHAAASVDHLAVTRGHSVDAAHSVVAVDIAVMIHGALMVPVVTCVARAIVGIIMHAVSRAMIHFHVPILAPPQIVDVSIHAITHAGSHVISHHPTHARHEVTAAHRLPGAIPAPHLPGAIPTHQVISADGVDAAVTHAVDDVDADLVAIDAVLNYTPTLDLAAKSMRVAAFIKTIER
jgi:hypothetical protein